MTREQEVWLLADAALKKVVDQIKDDQWGIKLPEWFAIGRTQDRDKVTLRDIINYHAYDEAWVPDTLAGKTIEEVGSKYDGDLLGADPKASWQALYDKATVAVSSLDDPEKMVHLTYGDWPAKEYLRHTMSFRGFRTFDIAKLIGADTTLPNDLLEGMWELVMPDVEEWRKMGVYGPAISVSSDASMQDKLLAASGRDPKTS